MQKTLFVLTTFLFAHFLQAQVSMNATLLGQWHDPSLPTHSGLKYNDCWGYTDPDDGREYAILGSAGQIHFLDITDPTNITEVGRFGNLNANGTASLSIWRDFKTFGHYAYAVADQSTTNEGLIVFDLSNLPTSVTKVHQSTSDFNRSHNIFIDEVTEKIYLPGSNTHGGGIIVMDLSTTPEAPVELGAPNMPGGYSHDIYVRNDTAYCFHGSNPSRMYVYDFASPTSPVQLGILSGYSNSGYNHSGWLTEDSQYLIFCDESSGRNVKVADLSDLTDITAPLSWQFNANLDNDSPLSNIAHNPFVKGDYVYVAYYKEGLQVWDISDPENAQLEAYYDTNTNSNAGVFDGAWGTYPFYDSGKVIISDTETGLYVVDITTILPVELSRFTAEKSGKKTLLEWQTDFERNNDRFEVEHSTDGTNFELIGEVKGKGNSQAPEEYSFTDENPQPGLNYYRLKQVDFDGAFEYSEVRQVEFTDIFEVEIFPTVLAQGEEVQVKFSGLSTRDFSLNISDASGKVIRVEKISRFTTQESLNLNLPAGVYTLSLTNQLSEFVQRLVVE